MQQSEQIEVVLEYAARVLIRTFLMGYILLIIWFLLFLFGFDWMYRWHTQWFEMSRSSFYIIHYCGMGLTKLSLIVFFLFPYLAIRLVLKSKARP